MENLKNKIVSIQRKWMLLRDYENKILIPTINLPTCTLSSKIEKTSEFIEKKEKMEFERELYITLLNARVDIEY